MGFIIRGGVDYSVSCYCIGLPGARGLGRVQHEAEGAARLITIKVTECNICITPTDKLLR